jgi:hypothetical protein
LRIEEAATVANGVSSKGVVSRLGDVIWYSHP